MPVTDPNIQITIRGTHLGQSVQVQQWYSPIGAAFLTADLLGVAEAYWNNIKTVWRAMFVVNSMVTTDSILIREGNPVGAFAEFPIPVGERQGTRSGAGLGGFMPTFVAAGFRETVATRATRPGQKRIWGLMEVDVGDAQELSAGYTTLLAALAPKFASLVTLGAPVATGNLQPLVVRLEGTPQVVTVSQNVTGFLINPLVTSQVSRKARQPA